MCPSVGVVLPEYSSQGLLHVVQYLLIQMRHVKNTQGRWAL